MTQHVRNLRSLIVAIILGALGGARSNAVGAEPPANPAAAPVLLDNMDRAPRLELLNAGGSIRVLSHTSDNSRSRFGSAAERLVLAAPAGESAQVAYRMPRAPVLDELALTAWVQCSRPGVRLAAVLALPHTKNPQGEPTRLMVFGEESTTGSDWLRLSLHNLRPALERQVRVMRIDGPRGTAAPASIDDRQAYLEALVVLCPGGSGTTELLVDQVALYGVIQDSATAGGASGAAAANSAASPASLPPLPPVPLAPRVIQWQGEAFAELRKLGFDAAALGRTPLPEELTAARKAQLYLICPPPLEESVKTIGPGFDIVMAWDLGALAVDVDSLADLQRRASWLKRADPQRSRMTLLHPGLYLREASQLCDALILERPTIGSSLSLSAYSTWLIHQRRLARPGMPAWMALDTHHTGRLAMQLAAVQSGRAMIVPARYADLFRWTAASIPSRPAGFFFRSEAPLTANDRRNRMRAITMELLNQRIALIQPWLARGKQLQAAACSRKDVTAIVLQTERSHLIVPMLWETDQAPARISPDQPLAIRLPGVPESSEAYLVGGVSAERLRSRRVTGGMQITLERLPNDALIVLTEDGQAYSQIERHLRAYARHVVDLRNELVELKRQAAAEALGLLPQPLVSAGEVQGVLHRVAALSAATQTAIAAHDYVGACDAAQEADAILDDLETRTVAHVAGRQAPGETPLPLRWESAPDHIRLAAALARSAGAWKPVPGGEFEDLNDLLQLGWRHLEIQRTELTTAVRLSPEGPHQGTYCLELESRPLRTDVPLATVTAPVWITSPGIAAPAGSMVEITGMFRSTEPLVTPDEALVLFDSLGGEQLALRLQSAPQWTPFRMTRFAGDGGELRLTFALEGLGRVEIDSLQYRVTPLASPAAPAATRLQARQASPPPR